MAAAAAENVRAQSLATAGVDLGTQGGVFVALLLAGFVLTATGVITRRTYGIEQQQEIERLKRRAIVLGEPEPAGDVTPGVQDEGAGGVFLGVEVPKPR